MRLLGLALVASLVLPSLAMAGRPQAAGRARQRGGLARQANPSALEQAAYMNLDDRFVFRLAHEVNALRRADTRAAARFFEKITVGKNYSGEHVLFRDQDVTAFLDMSDPQHPRFDPQAPPDEELESIPAARRTHVLVVPNVPREHIGRTLGSQVTSSDLEAALRVTRAAERLATQLGIKNARVFLNPSEHVMVGYLHVHIVGERDPAKPYPSLAPPQP